HHGKEVKMSKPTLYINSLQELSYLSDASTPKIKYIEMKDGKFSGAHPKAASEKCKYHRRSRRTLHPWAGFAIIVLACVAVGFILGCAIPL
ncbi:MAG: hypothetical protein RSF13_09480, partial [Clostridiales bacterium]